MVTEYLTFAGVSSRDFGIYISGLGTFNAPERDGAVVTVPGRNGTLYFDNGRYANIQVEYPAFIVRKFATNMEGARNWLLNNIGYQRLEDTYHPDEFRLARYSGKVSADVKTLCTSGELTMVFDCKPQRFLKSGEREIEFLEDGVISNPTDMVALPLIRVYGYGDLSVGTTTLSIKRHDKEYIDIDCDIQDAYCGNDNMNSSVILASGEFPVFKAGENNISFSGHISGVIIKPRWWRL